MEYIKVLRDTPLPTILVILGSIFLLLAIARIDKYIKMSPKQRKQAAGVGILFLILGVGLYLIPVPVHEGRQETSLEGSQNVTPIKTKYSFESGTSGWICQDYEDSRACIQVLQSDEIAKEGLYSLKMVMNLIGDDAHKSKGEAWINMLDVAPNGQTVPVDLSNRTITAWIYAPQGSRGERSIPNGFQLFVKDEDWNNEYSSWKDVAEGIWNPISFPVSASEPSGGSMDVGFNPRRIIALGVKMAVGDGSMAKFDGAVYIDAIDW